LLRECVLTCEQNKQSKRKEMEGYKDHDTFTEFANDDKASIKKLGFLRITRYLYFMSSTDSTFSH
jgi:predicted transcriptional regulator